MAKQYSDTGHSSLSDPYQETADRVMDDHEHASDEHPTDSHEDRQHEAEARVVQSMLEEEGTSQSPVADRLRWLSVVRPLILDESNSNLDIVAGCGRDSVVDFVCYLGWVAIGRPTHGQRDRLR